MAGSICAGLAGGSTVIGDCASSGVDALQVGQATDERIAGLHLLSSFPYCLAMYSLQCLMLRSGEGLPAEDK